MIEQGDGTFAIRMALGLCPRCQTSLTRVRNESHVTEYECKACKLRINDVKEKPRDS
jgi:predicted SprT family Zn-dependent metalloprotease